MEEEKEKVIIFPRWKDNLEKKAKEAMEANHFGEALGYFDLLTANGVVSHEVHTGKLICMMEMQLHEEAEIYCEALLSEHNDYYFSYLHIYTTLLLESSKYKEIIELLDDVFRKEEIPDLFKSQLEHIYKLSKELFEQESEQSFSEIIEKLKLAVIHKNDRQQWYMMKQLHSLKLSKDIPILKQMLVDENIHPVVKSAILEYYIETKPVDTLALEKFNIHYEWDLKEVHSLSPSDFFSGVYNYLEDIESNDPTSYQMMQFVLNRFAYVYAPFLPEEENYQALAETLRYYVHMSYELKNHSDDTRVVRLKEHYLNMIETSEALYASIIDM